MRATRSRHLSIALVCVLIAGCGGAPTPVPSAAPSLGPTAAPTPTPAASPATTPSPAPTPTALASPSPPTSPAPAEGWRSFPVEGDIAYSYVSQLTWFKGRWVAVGYAGGESGGPPGAWWSTDGSTWQPATIDDPSAHCTGTAFDCPLVSMDAVAPFKGRLVAVGSRVWTSTDGRSWKRMASSSLPDGRTFDVASDGGRLVAVGARGNAAAAWTSTDGRRWVRASSIRGAGRRVMLHVAVVDGVFVATGSAAESGWPDGAMKYAWRSGDGRTWSRVADARPALTPTGDSWAVAVPGGFVVHRNWPLNIEQGPVAAEVPGGYVAAADGVWATADGEAWEPLVPGTGLYAFAVAASPDQVLVMTDVEDPTSGEWTRTVWLGPTPGETPAATSLVAFHFVPSSAPMGRPTPAYLRVVARLVPEGCPSPSRVQEHSMGVQRGEAP